MNTQDPEVKMQISREYLKEFCLTEVDVMSSSTFHRYSVYLKSYTYERAIKYIPEITQEMIKSLAELYIKDSSKTHLRKYARMKLEMDMGM